jgi:hypothetical protein
MKKISVFTTITFLVITLSSFKNSSSDFSVRSSSLKEIYKQEQTVDAFIMWGGNWRKGRITYMSTQQGYKPISYQFQDVDYRLKGKFFSEKFTPLNPNNELAKANNWTHTIGIQGTTAYLILN